MKIAIICNQAFSLLNFRMPLMAEMAARGYEVLAFAPDFNEDHRAVLATMGVHAVDYNISRSGTNPLKEMVVILELRRLLRIHQPDLCFGYFIKPVIYGTLAAALAGVPRRFGLYAGLGFAFTNIATQSRKRRLLQRVILALARLSAKHCHRVMFQNPDDMNELIDRGIVSTDKAVLVGATGLDLDEWPCTSLPNTPLTFILVARLLRDKGIGEYVAAARMLRVAYPELRFLVLGSIDDNPASITREEMEAWVTEGLIEWPGHVVTKPWLVQAHVFVLPSYREGVPRSTQEAMAMGRAIITTNAPGCKETVIEGLNGFMVPPRNHVALAEAMRYFIENPGDIARMGSESRKLACERFDVRVQNAKLLSYLGL
ncbi:putative glycosyltransferase [Caenibius tardaugens NBRC 16725]|uniref:Putative glycosyltransferase n=1 Tax=Caenibius tardaugens NBRC 16725 TaxID=1219035 RepID=U2YQB7_9SPHN|nr:glycosyltransferase family 4 protein [Caenibius tardaugens]AZI36361.1 glycosyltransferase family 1 protein [Caenibius tardaugens NBRC 16725]GAD50837.1 putative glycosyltransferase [Caenibius tardaugens NBRC 16725]